jgi:hypothetical protein
MSNPDRFFEDLASRPAAEQGASSRLKSRIYSALVERQAEEGPLASLGECHQSGSKLCVFEHLVRIAPLPETVKSWNPCRVCHARLLAERVEDAPIFWPGCPYVEFQS